MSFFEELKRRNVFKVAAAYIIVAWLLLQVSDTLVPALHLPDWFHSGVAFVLILGFPVAIIFAWAFEMTPEGLKRESEVDRSQSITHETSRKLDFIIIGVMAVALGYFAYDKFALDPQRDTAMLESASRQSTQSTEQPEQAEKPHETAYQSVAVLPFVNMSDDPGNEYFSDGLSEELINVLVRIEGLRVPSRTSSFAFKDQNIAIRDIAQQLKVTHILEGSVRKAGNTIRVTAQLIDVGTDTHLWSETYDRQLEGIFAIQEEIAGKIVAALQETLGTDQGVNVAPLTDDMEAYQLYLRGKHLFSQRSVGPAIDLLSRAVELDPEFAEAWSSLAVVYVVAPPL